MTLRHLLSQSVHCDKHHGWQIEKNFVSMLVWTKKWNSIFQDFIMRTYRLPSKHLTLQGQQEKHYKKSERQWDPFGICIVNFGFNFNFVFTLFVVFQFLTLNK